MGFCAQRSANVRGHFPVGTYFCAFAFFALRCRKRCEFIYSKFSVRMAFDYGYSATLCLGIFPVRFSVEPASLRIAYANTNALGFNRFPSGIDYDVVCASQMRPLSRNSDFAFLGNRAFDGFLVCSAHSLLFVRLDVFANEKAGTLTDENTITCSAGRKRKEKIVLSIYEEMLRQVVHSACRGCRQSRRLGVASKKIDGHIVSCFDTNRFDGRLNGLYGKTNSVQSNRSKDERHLQRSLKRDFG